MVTRKLGGPSAANTMSPETNSRILDTLLRKCPCRNRRKRQSVESLEGEIPLFTELGPTSAVTSLKNRKAPGPDEVPTEEIKMVASAQLQLLLKMCNTCLRAGIFASPWKVA